MSYVSLRELALGQRQDLLESLGGLAERLGTPEVDLGLRRLTTAHERVSRLATRRGDPFGLEANTRRLLRVAIEETARAVTGANALATSRQEAAVLLRQWLG